MRVNKYERIATFFILFLTSLICIIIILGMLKWKPALILIEWANTAGFIGTLVLFIILFILSFSMSFVFILYKEKNTITIGNPSGLGEVSISINGVKNAIRDIANYFAEIQEVRPEIENLKGKIVLTLRVRVPSGTDITRVVNELQHRIKVYFENVLSLNLDNINIIVDDVVPVKRGK